MCNLYSITTNQTAILALRGHGSGPPWVREIKHDGYRLMVRRDGARVRCFTRNGYDWADRFPAIVDAAHRIKARSFMLDGEAVIARDDGTPAFRALRSRGRDAVLHAFDLIEHDGDDLRDLALIDRKRRLARLIGRAKHGVKDTAPPGSSPDRNG